MVDVDKELAIRRFPWTYTKVYDKENTFIGFRVRLDFILVTNPDDLFKFDMYHFTSQSDMMDNASLARDCGLEVSFGSTNILATPNSYKHIFQQIQEFEQLCALHPTT